MSDRNELQGLTKAGRGWSAGDQVEGVFGEGFSRCGLDSVLGSRGRTIRG